MLRKRSGRRTSGGQLRDQDAAGGRREDRVVAAQCAELRERIALRSQRFRHALEHQLRRGQRLGRAIGIDQLDALRDRVEPAARRSHSARPSLAGSIGSRRVRRRAASARRRMGVASDRSARCGGPHRQRRSRCHAPCGRRPRRRSVIAPSSFPLVQQPLQIVSCQRRQAHRLERARPVSEVAAEETAGDGEQTLRDRRIDAAQRATEARNARPSSVSSVM